MFPANTVRDVRIRSQDHQRQYGTDSVFWIKQKPLYENRKYAQFLSPDGKNSIFIRQADILPGRDAETGMRLATVFTDQRYSIMNLEKLNDRKKIFCTCSVSEFRDKVKI